MVKSREKDKKTGKSAASKSSRKSKVTKLTSRLTSVSKKQSAAAPKRKSRTKPFKTIYAEQKYNIPVAAASSSPASAVRQRENLQSRWQRRQELPSNYGDNQIFLMVRDPQWLYTYWEIQNDLQDKTLAKLGGSWEYVKTVLRVYDITERKGLPSFWDIPVFGLVSNWTIQVKPNRSYFVELGLLHRDGRFVAMVRSNEVTTPRDGMSEVLDERWMGIDFDKIYALSGGFEMGKGSIDLQKMMAERLSGAVSSGSGGFSSGSIVKKKPRGFWFVLDCELIVYGATEPDAKVKVQGKDVKLRRDGTFTLRFALPDGKQVIDACAKSADGLEEREITPIVERKTERPAPVVTSGKGK